ncbi:MAG: hypothetical protein J0M08_06745 [Bacteroidetes bacterium]|nr:hypothetical protein [Bacteroidota bacterium]
MTIHKTVFDKGFRIVPADEEFEYQKDLTAKLDTTTELFDQQIINEIVLWKINRYANVDGETLKLLNEIDPNSKVLDIEKTRRIVKILINIKGIQLPMASTILRFKNKNIYQIIDQRVYRIIYKDKKLILKTHLNDTNLNEMVDLYLQYLKDLTEVCKQFKIPFHKSDRILFMVDKRINKDIPLDNYSTKS